MSTNIYISASREIVALKTCKICTQTIKFNTWQTPTEVTRQIMNSSNPLQAYKDWVMTQSEDEQVPVYAESDWLCEREPIRYDTYNDAKDHIESLDSWIKEAEADGYTVKFESF